MNTKKNKKGLDLAQWYVITIVNGNEDSVIKNLKGKIEAYGLSDLIQDIKCIKNTIITEEIFSENDCPSNYGRKIKDVVWETFKDANGKNKFKKIKTQEVNAYFGYIFIKMVMTEEAWYTIRNTNLITGIVGSSGKNTKPIPVGEDEIGRILNVADSIENAQSVLHGDKEITKTDDAILIKKINHNFHVGQNVKITSGQFANEIGTITYIDETKNKLLISINLFGRDTETEISFEDVELDI